MACALSVAISATACASGPKNPGKIGNSGSEYKLAGNGPATVVFEAGLGDTMTTWHPVRDRVSQFARTFVYNRPGYGKSPALPGTPSAEAIARNLYATLEKAGAPRPWVLVGHSLGGSYAMTFAKLYPQDVKAVVLVDGTAPGQTEMLKSEMKDVYNIVRTLTGIMGKAAKAEFKASESGGTEFRNLGAFPRIPVYLLRRSKWSPVESDAFRRRVVGMQRETAGLSPCPKEREVPLASHYIHRDQPSVVVQTIEDAVRSNGCN